MTKAPSTVWRKPVHFLAFGFGSGTVPFAPGTAGTVVAVLLYSLMPAVSWQVYCLLLGMTLVVGIWLCGETARDIGVHDHGGIVWDEFVGYWITMFLAPPGWIWILAGFILFRLFDIVKPWPIKWLDRNLQGGLGIMLDDVIAGIMAFFCLQLAARLAGL